MSVQVRTSDRAFAGLVSRTVRQGTRVHRPGACGTPVRGASV